LAVAGVVGARRRERAASPGAWPPGSAARRRRESSGVGATRTRFVFRIQSAAARRRRDAIGGATRAESLVRGSFSLPVEHWIRIALTYTPSALVKDSSA
jgi:hypothetical protein